MSAQAEELTAELTVEDLWPPGCTDSAGTRARNALKREGITTAGQVAARTEEELLDIRNLGVSALAEVRRALAEHGLALAVREPGELPAAGGPSCMPQSAACAVEVCAAGVAVCSRRVAHELSVSYRQLDYWVRREFLKPEQDRNASGSFRRWPEAEVCIARRMRRLIEGGVDVARAAAFARNDWPRGEIAPGIRIEVDE